jgi:hypothetical protein
MMLSVQAQLIPTHLPISGVLIISRIKSLSSSLRSNQNSSENSIMTLNKATITIINMYGFIELFKYCYRDPMNTSGKEADVMQTEGLRGSILSL